MLYLFIKYIHILSSTILFGTGLGTACVMVYGHLHKNLKVRAAIYRYVVMADWIFTAPSGFIQPLSGFILVYLAHYNPWSYWLVASVIGYLIAAFCWFPVVYLQIKLRDMVEVAANHDRALPKKYTKYYRWWFILGWPAFLSLMYVFYLMVVKPQ